ncbi:glycoside hydrolase family 16 protein [Dendrothele bispora CBS 962.96]|uniref:Glycoside hydrolase family 16 protein n=1 Tax=Dendrothele bispora (strain CBS 962.96) TaxID=1314807 RepID=A0A4S8M011_DENBC|nr:glycoside hydrolase family 16 protein [Dendrothele bispora CBS 962.96]
MLYISFLILALSFSSSAVIAQQGPQVFQIPNPQGQQYVLQDTYQDHGFYDWLWETNDDPTHGRVNYVDQQTAIERNLTYASEGKFVMRADHTSMVAPGGRGRDSNRIQSKKAYSNSLFVLDVQHMPTGCGTWPAFWSLSQAGPWPHGGEIDIIEGVNQNTKNLASLHTLPNCNMPQSRVQTGQTISVNCDSAVNFNQGCGVASTQESSYGPGFNACGGGWYVMERNNVGIKIWFFSRCSPPPPEFQSTSLPINTGNWSPPDAYFPFGDNCSYLDHFDAHSIVFDLTFCGDWAGSAFPTSGCGPAQCADFVDQNPGAFTEAYWEINSLRIYLPS